jgi:hypothetical protein
MVTERFPARNRLPASIPVGVKIEILRIIRQEKSESPMIRLRPLSASQVGRAFPEELAIRSCDLDVANAPGGFNPMEADIPVSS